MASPNNRLRRPILLHRGSSETIKSVRVLVERRGRRFAAVAVKKLSVKAKPSEEPKHAGQKSQSAA